MSRKQPHSRSGPAATTGAAAGASRLQPTPVDGDVASQDAATAGGREGSAAGIASDGPGSGAAAGAPPGGEPLPMQPGREYVDKADHERIAGELAHERDAMRADLQRIAADFENYKRRAAREREQAAAAADAKLLGELLAVIDDMERALEHAEQAKDTHPNLAEGVAMVHRRLDSVIRAHGLEKVDTSGQFDPALHEAMMVQPAGEGVEEGAIVQVLQSGWTLGERVLRHARVIVAGEG